MDEDQILVARLNDLFTRHDPPPAEVVGLAQGLFGLRRLDAELAELTADSAVDGLEVAVRGGDTRLLTFETAELAIEMEVSGTGRTRRVVGQLVPGGPASLEARQPSGPPRQAEADARGRFEFDGLAPEPFSLTWSRPGARPVTTQWTGLE
ncbi:hypothetical protein [Virgisporangium ochraceum]|uniref:Carboxypeptidase regulatory-like domain-containing protein n=1 Tax=Virgisporangium ochraceum TaxID=65505 RepID=A0A8J3ZRE1_9ACTN|nr:hypothetical protein [Virgisporangium ochraceum]GIJ68341.1 hypothetical protein Voc01_032580 [Virgisporangium ochraceum]